MKIKNALLVLFVTCGLAITFSVNTPAAPRAKAASPRAAEPAAAPAPAATPAPVPPHPEIREAIEALRHARIHLQMAAHDFGGHREDALRATDEAIRQLQICMKYE